MNKFWNDPNRIPRECIHGVPLPKDSREDHPCAGCREIDRLEKARKQLERKLRGTPLGRLCGLK